GKYVLYAQVIDFSVIGKTEGGGRHPERIAIGKGVGNTFDEAAFDLYKTSQEKTSWSHISALIFTQRAIKAGVPETSIDLMRRYHEFRQTMWTFGTRDSLEHIMLCKPIMDISSLYSRLTDPMGTYKQSSLIQPTFLNTIIASSKEPAQTTILPYLAVAPDTWTGDKGEQPVLEMEGVGAILNGQYQGFLKLDELQGLRWVQRKHTRMAVFSYYEGKPLAAVIVVTPKYEIISNMVGNKPSFEIHVKAKGGTLEISQVLPESQIREQVNKQVAKEIRDTYLAGLKKNVDVLNLGLELYRQHPAEWRRIQKNGQLPLTPDSLKNVQVEIDIKLTGRLKQLKRDQP
ncbi:MAG: Ger(x)C family spore germination protein, partial [Tumebacillaceae bacterium]